MTNYTDGIIAEVRAAAARKRMTQTDIGAVLHLSRMAVHRRMTGEVEFSVSELYALAAAFDINVRDLLPEEVAA